jgi:hypothetical protein
MEAVMEEYSVDLLPGQILQWVREDAQRKHPSLWVRGSREYEAAEGAVPRIADDDDVNVVNAAAVLEISPQGKAGGWTLQLRAAGTAELRAPAEGNSYDPDADLNIDSFESEFLNPLHGEVDVTVQVEDAAARNRFEQWLERMIRR